MMKKWLAVMLLLCMLIPCAQAAGKLENTELRVVRNLDENNAEINVYIVVKNTGDAPVSLDEANVVFLDEAGNALFDEDEYSMYPGTLQPGETGYIKIWAYGVDKEKAQAVKSYTLTIEPEDEAEYVVSRLPFTAEYKCLMEGYFEEYIVEFAVTNNTAETIWEPCFYMVLRDEAGKIFSMKDMKAYGVGIPAGTTVYYRADVEYDAEMYIKEGHTPTAECVVYLETY